MDIGNGKVNADNERLISVPLRLAIVETLEALIDSVFPEVKNLLAYDSK